MTERVEQQICIKICVKLEHSFVETIQIIQKAAAMGNCWLAASSRLRTRLLITSHTEFFGETSNHPGDLAPLWPRFSTLGLLAFPKTKITFEMKRLQTVDEIQENMTGQLIAIGRSVWGPKVPTLKRTEMSLSYVQCFLYLVSHPCTNQAWPSLASEIRQDWVRSGWCGCRLFLVSCMFFNKCLCFS